MNIRPMNRVLSFVTSLALVALALAPATARAESEADIAKDKLQKQITLCDAIKPYLERSDVPRLAIMSDATKRVIASINEVGVAHMKTMGEYQILIITYRSSKMFLESVMSDAVAQQVTDLNAVTAQIATDTGIDGWPTKMVYGIFTQMRDQFTRLRQLPIPAALQNAIGNLDADFGNVLALGLEGDRPKTFEAATALYYRIVALYPQIESVGGSTPAFDVGLTIRALSEFYAEYAQVHQ